MLNVDSRDDSVKEAEVSVKEPEGSVKETEKIEEAVESVIEAVTEIVEEVEKEIKEPSRKRLFTLGVPAALLAVIAVVAVVLFGGGSSYGVASDLTLFHGQNKVLIVYNDGTTAEIDSAMHDMQKSLNGSKGAIMTNRDYIGSTGTLYYISGSGAPTIVSENVNGYVLSDSGDGLIYFTEFDSDASTATLNIYDGRSTTVIDEDAFFEPNSGVATAVVSPDGKMVLYLKDVEAQPWDNTVKSSAYVWTSSKGTEEFSSDIVPIAIANSAKYLYYISSENEEASFMVRRGLKGESVKIGNQSVSGVFFNNDYSQAVFNQRDGQWGSFFSVNGGEAQQISNEQIWDFIIPANGQVKRNSPITVYGFSDFNGKAFTADDGLFLLDRKFGRERITGQVSDIIVSNDGKQIFYIEDGNLRAASMSDPSGRKPVFAENIRNFVVASGGYFYYVDFSNELYRQNVRNSNNGAGGTWVAELVVADSLCVSGKGTVFFINTDGDLFSTSNTSRNRIKSNIYRVVAHNNNAFYYFDADGGFFDIYRSRGNGRFSLLFFDVKLSSKSTDWEQPTPDFDQGDWGNEDWGDDYWGDDGWGDDDWDNWDGGDW
jgi:hypothetical protein